MKLFEGMANKMKDKEKKTLPKIVILLAAGVILLLISSMFADGSGSLSGIFGAGSNATPPPHNIYIPTQHTNSTNLNDHVFQLEQRLEELLSSVEGAGRVRVMLTVSRGREIVLANTHNIDNSSTRETDSAGGTRDIETTREQEAYVIIRTADGSEAPLVLAELEPTIEGVAIVAEGGNCIVVANNLIRLTAAALGIGIHLVHLAPAAS